MTNTPDALTVAVTAAKALADVDGTFLRIARSFEVRWSNVGRGGALHLSVPATVAVSTDIGMAVVCT